MIGPFGKIWSLFGIVLSASSIISLIQAGFDLKLALSLSEVLNYYRELVEPIYNFLYTPLLRVLGDFKIPNWAMDTQTLSLIVSSIYVRAKNAQRINGKVIHFKSQLSKISTVFILGVTMIGLLFLPFILIGMFMLPIYYINQLRWHKHLKWHQFNKVLQAIYMAAGNEGAIFNTSAIYAYLTLIVVFTFYVWNYILL